MKGCRGGGGNLNGSSVVLSSETAETGPRGATSRQPIRGSDVLAKYLMGNSLCMKLIYREEGNDYLVIQQTIDILWLTVLITNLLFPLISEDSL